MTGPVRACAVGLLALAIAGTGMVAAPPASAAIDATAAEVEQMLEEGPVPSIVEPAESLTMGAYDLDGEPVPASLGWADTGGGFAVTGTTLTSQVRDEPGAPLEIGALQVEPLDVAAGASHPVPIADGNLLVSVETGEQTDTVVKPVGVGLEILFNIRDPDAPTSFRYRLSGPRPVRLERDGDAVVAKDGDDIVATITAPWAQDATGAAVATTLEVEGADEDVLVFEVAHQGHAYPVLADPVIDMKTWTAPNTWYWPPSWGAATPIVPGGPTYGRRRLRCCCPWRCRTRS